MNRFKVHRFAASRTQQRIFAKGLLEELCKGLARDDPVSEGVIRDVCG